MTQQRIDRRHKVMAYSNIIATVMMLVSMVSVYIQYRSEMHEVMTKQKNIINEQTNHNQRLNKIEVTTDSLKNETDSLKQNK